MSQLTRDERSDHEEEEESSTTEDEAEKKHKLGNGEAVHMKTDKNGCFGCLSPPEDICRSKTVCWVILSGLGESHRCQKQNGNKHFSSSVEGKWVKCVNSPSEYYKTKLKRALLFCCTCRGRDFVLLRTVFCRLTEQRPCAYHHFRYVLFVQGVRNNHHPTPLTSQTHWSRLVSLYVSLLIIRWD